MIFRLFKLLKCYSSDQTAASAVEYVLLVSAVAMAIVAVVFTMGDSLEIFFNDAADGMDGE